MNPSSFHRRKASDVAPAVAESFGGHGKAMTDMMADTVKFPLSLKLPTSPRLRWTGQRTGRRTGKIALLFMFLCANTLFGMKRSAGEHYVEPDTGSELKPEIWGQLPDDVKTLIMVVLAQSGDNLDEAIANIKKVSELNKVFNQIINAGNLQGFTQLVHILADKFGESTDIVAEKFGTPVAKQYIELGDLLELNLRLLFHFPESTDKIIALIKNGADVNFSNFEKVHDKYVIITLMDDVIQSHNFKAIKLLLRFGAKLESDEYYDEHNFWPEYMVLKQVMKQFIDEERAKRQQ